MHPDRVSIVIPCFNDDPEHIGESVGSALAQTYGDVEVVVVDDGSTRAETVVALQALEGVTLLSHSNAGPGAALNAGIERASGEFILPLGADDRISSDFVEVALRRLRASGPATVGVYPTVEFMGERSGLMRVPPIVELKDLAVRNQVVAVTLYRREHWEVAGGYGNFDDCSEDWYFWGVLLGRSGGRMVQEPQARLFYRIRPGSRNSVNRGVDRKANARRHISEALPEKATYLYLAASEQADAAIADAERYGSFVMGWRRRLRPIAPAYKYLHRVLPKGRG